MKLREGWTIKLLLFKNSVHVLIGSGIDRSRIDPFEAPRGRPAAEPGPPQKLEYIPSLLAASEILGVFLLGNG